MKKEINILDEMMKEYKWLLKSSLTRDWERKYTGAYQALEQAKSRIQALDDGWIEVIKKLPPYTGKYPEEYVIVFNWVAVYESKFSDGKFYHIWNCEREYEDTNVTHWMPLPTLPFIKWLNAN